MNICMCINIMCTYAYTQLSNIQIYAYFYKISILAEFVRNYRMFALQQTLQHVYRTR